MNPIYDFKGQVAFVTGAAMGMGLAAARARCKPDDQHLPACHMAAEECFIASNPARWVS
jgi:NAD(P)-dependent dehydrogenase (short-subunit alcohol dehydrogenase family)